MQKIQKKHKTTKYKTYKQVQKYSKTHAINTKETCKSIRKTQQYTKYKKNTYTKNGTVEHNATELWASLFSLDVGLN